MAGVNISTTASVADGFLLLGSGSVLESVRDIIDSAARSESKVLITGETGTGKEVVARMIHAQSARRRQNFVAVNCAGLPDDLLESELFGHVRGSFTGAYRDKLGLAAQADRGTLFLDELGEMTPRMQGVLLRFVETGEIHPVGSDRVQQRADARIIAATNRNLPARVESGQFREDLYYRMNVIQVAIPPLRERGHDILELFGHYLERFCQTQRREAPARHGSADALLLAYPWPGNVRELKNVAERIALRDVDGPITADHLPAEMRGTRPAPLSLLKPAAPAPSGALPSRERWAAADAAWDDMVRGHRSFWAVVHPRFMNRELTKADVREIVRLGLEQTHGSYRKLVELFHMPQTDYKRFLAFLTQHDCHLKFHDFRAAASDR